MKRHVLSIIYIMATPLLLAGDKPREFRIEVYASVEPIASLVSYLGEFIEAEVLIPSWANPHGYEPKPQDIKKLGQADLFVLVGANFEPQWIERLIESSESVPVIYLANILTDADVTNPHIWLSLRNAIKILSVIKDTLKRFIPVSVVTLLESNFKLMERRIKSLDSLYTERFNSLKDRKFASLHRAWSYIANDYSLQEIAVMQVEHERGPGPRTVKRFIETIESERVKVVFADRFVPKDFIDLIKRETECKVLILEPIGGGAPSLGYLELMENNLKKIYRALSDAKR